ncbi:MAG: alpha/beta hydrolase [Castellaniella sp.]
MIQRQHRVFQGEAGDIDAIIDWPQGDVRGWALVLHPHPQQGGTRENKVVTTIARACVQEGLVAVRPNFRGVGASAGNFDNGVGETADMLALVEQFRRTWPQVAAGCWVLGGFSFGTSVAAQLYSTLAERESLQASAVILAGPAVERFRFREVRLPDDVLLIHGEQDEVVPLAETMDYARKHDFPVVVIPDATHFFHGKLIALRGLVALRLKSCLAAGSSL